MAALSREGVAPKTLQYEAFLNNTLKPDLQRSLDVTARLQAQVDEYDELEACLREIQTAGRTSLKTQVDLGAEVCCQAYVPDTSTVFIRIPLGFHVECKLDEAPRIIQLQREALEAQVDDGRRQSAKIRANIKLVEEGLRELMNLQQQQ